MKVEAVAGELLGHQGAAGLVASLDDEDLGAGLGQIGGRRQAVVTRADNDDIALLGFGHTVFSPLSGLRIRLGLVNRR